MHTLMAAKCWSLLYPEQSRAGLPPSRQVRAAGGTQQGWQEVAHPQEPVQKWGDAPAQGLLAYGRGGGWGMLVRVENALAEIG